MRDASEDGTDEADSKEIHQLTRLGFWEAWHSLNVWWIPARRLHMTSESAVADAFTSHT